MRRNGCKRQVARTGDPPESTKERREEGGWKSASFRERQSREPGLSLAGEAGEHHRHVIAHVLVSRAGDHHTVAMHFPWLARRLQGQSHFGPGRKRSRTPKFDTVLVDNHRTGGQRQTRLPRFDRDMVQRPNFNFSRAHTAWIYYHLSKKGQFDFDKINDLEAVDEVGRVVLNAPLCC